MLGDIALVYGITVAVFLAARLWAASSAVKFSNQARGKELKQFYKGVANDNLGLIKWSPLWPNFSIVTNHFISTD
jgi:hypothetical protein